MQQSCPGFTIWIRKTSVSGVLPQSRTRVWLIGMRTSILRASGVCYPDDPMEVLRSRPNRDRRQPRLKDLLGDFPRCASTEITGPAARLYLEQYKDSAEAFLTDPRNEGRVACFDLSRGPDKVYGSRVRFDQVSTLKTGNSSLFLVEGGKGRNPPLHRFLQLGERFTLQGINPLRALGMNRTQALKAVGNAFPPVLVGAVVYPLLKMVFFSKCLHPEMIPWPLQAEPAAAPWLCQPRARRQLLCQREPPLG